MVRAENAWLASRSGGGGLITGTGVPTLEKMDVQNLARSFLLSHRADRFTFIAD
jgi:hypothetical protein